MTGLIILFVAAFALIVLFGSFSTVWQIVRPRRKTYVTAVAQDLPTDPAELGREADEVTFNLPGPHTTPGWIVTGDKPDGPTVLVLHGHGDATFGALRFVEHLAPYASHVVVFDWPGHGKCTAPWMTCGVREPADAAAVLDGLPEALADRPVVLFGYSLGGQIAIKTAAQHPRFAGVVVDGPYRHWDSPIYLRLKRMRVPAWPFMPLVALTFHAMGLIRDFDRAQYAKQINIPLLVLHGTDDHICPIEEARQLAEAAPHGIFVPIQDARHNRLHEHDPEGYHAALQTFFEKIAPVD